MGHSYPHFLIVGFMKAATTTVFDHIIQHPGVQAPLMKELHYFTRELNSLYDPLLYGLEYHEQLRYDPKSEKICGEASPSYIVASERIAAFNPNTRIIVMLRDPVDRAISQYKQYLEFKLADYHDNLFDHDVGSLNFVQSSVYEPYVSKFLHRFPPANVLLVSFEHFCAAQQEAMRHIFRFLGLIPLAIAADKKLAQTAGDVSANVRQPLEHFFAGRRGKLVPLIEQFRPVTYPTDVAAFEKY